MIHCSIVFSSLYIAIVCRSYNVVQSVLTVLIRTVIELCECQFESALDCMATIKSHHNGWL
jgi:hypothetical protein